jgi:hypothetical protein
MEERQHALRSGVGQGRYGKVPARDPSRWRTNRRALAAVTEHAGGGQGSIRRSDASPAYENGVWKPLRLWDGDEADRGLCFRDKPMVVRVKMQRF